MPLLMCPNDNAPMQTVQRGGVEFDMCPTCRGVWLDRGELEKLMTMGGGETPPQRQAPASQPWGGDHRPPPRYDDDRRPQHDREPHAKYGYDKHGRPRKKKEGFDLFDIFD